MRWRVFLLGLASLLGFWLVVAKKPWNFELIKRPKIEEFFGIYSWYGVSFSVVIVVGLALLCGWWAGRKVSPGAVLQATQTPRWFWPLIGVAMLLSATFSFPRLGNSLWDDEEYNVRKSILGRYNIQRGDEPIKLNRLKWVETMGEYREPNNHVLHSLLARVSMEVWNGIGKPNNGLPFSETALRIPAYIFGILSIATLGLFLKGLGQPGAGVLAAWLLAMHPWHIRYTSECRGYSLVLFLVPLIFLFWKYAIQSGKWNWWLAFGASQFAILYTYPGTLFILLVLNLAAIPVLALCSEAAKPLSAQSGRWFVTNALSAIPVIILMLPLYEQVRDYMAYESGRNIAVGWPWVTNVLWHFVSGVAWNRGSSGTFIYPELAHQFSSGLWVPALAAWLTGIFAVIGAFWFLRKGPLNVILLIAILVPPIVTVCFARIRTQLIYEPYVISALPGFVALVSCGVFVVCERLLKQFRHPSLVPALAGALVIAFFAYTHPTRSWMMTHPLQQIRESTLISRGTLDPKEIGKQQLITASFCIPPYLYDPKAIRLESTTQFVELIQTAEESDRSLIVNIGMPWAARDFSPAMWKLINDPELFTQDHRLLGLDPGLDRILARYIPGSSVGYDFSEALTKER